MKVFCAVFLCIPVVCYFLAKEYWKKPACKMLVKLTTGVSFTNISGTAVLLSVVLHNFYVLLVCVCNFLLKEYWEKPACKMLLKLTKGWTEEGKEFNWKEVMGEPGSGFPIRLKSAEARFCAGKRMLNEFSQEKGKIKKQYVQPSISSTFYVRIFRTNMTFRQLSLVTCR